MLGWCKNIMWGCFCELWLPVSGAMLHYLRGDCIKRGRLSGTPAARAPHTHTHAREHTRKQGGFVEAQWKMQWTAIIRPKVPTTTQKRSNSHTQAPAGWSSLWRLWPHAPNTHRCCWDRLRVLLGSSRACSLLGNS